MILFGFGQAPVAQANTACHTISAEFTYCSARRVIKGADIVTLQQYPNITVVEDTRNDSSVFSFITYFDHKNITNQFFAPDHFLTIVKHFFEKPLGTGVSIDNRGLRGNRIQTGGLVGRLCWVRPKSP
ncbi:MAG: hypothetical protein AAF701_08280, partial [Pseudomonadota bacterium]